MDRKFSSGWKLAKLILLKKPKKPDKDPSSYRPICLLEDHAKLMEQIIRNRVIQHLDNTPNGLSKFQFGFRSGYSTADAIKLVKNTIQQVTNEKKITIAIALDIKNAFNSLPWRHMRDALRAKELPEYLAATIEDYLHDRKITL